MLLKDNGKSGTLKHRLVSYIMNYTREYFLNYVNDICIELDKRNIKYKEKYYQEINSFCWQDKMDCTYYLYPEHNHRYLCQCYYNLQEKYDRGIISEDEFTKIEDFIMEVTRNG